MKPFMCKNYVGLHELSLCCLLKIGCICTVEEYKAMLVNNQHITWKMGY